jgi:ribonuclease HI
MTKNFGFWNKEEQETSINVRELKVVYFALKIHAKKLENCTIRVFTDNTTALKYTVRFGGTASLQLQELAVMIQDICNEYNLKVVYQHIPGIKNTNADRLSKQQ